MVGQLTAVQGVLSSIPAQKTLCVVHKLWVWVSCAGEINVCKRIHDKIIVAPEGNLLPNHSCPATLKKIRIMYNYVNNNIHHRVNKIVSNNENILEIIRRIKELNWLSYYSILESFNIKKKSIICSLILLF